jgi:hypothetical protein
MSKSPKRTKTLASVLKELCLMSSNKNSEPRDLRSDLYVETVVVHGVMSQVVDSPELSVETWDEYRGCLQLRRWQTSSLGSAGKLAEQFW